MSRASEEWLEALAKELEEAAAREARSLSELTEELRTRIKPLKLKRVSSYHRVTGVDGSNAVYKAGGFATIIVKAVAVTLGEGVVEELGPLHFTIREPSDTLEMRMTAEELMSIVETLILARLEGRCDTNTLIIVDGPLQDPPRGNIPSTKLGSEALRRVAGTGDYHAWRAGIIRKLASRGCTLAFFVKRPVGSRLLTRTYDDEMVARIALDESEYTKPEPLPPRVLHYAQLNAVYSYVKLGSRVARVEVVPGDSAERALYALTALTPRGLPYPIPVLAAHTLTRVSVEDAKSAHILALERIARRLGPQLLARILSLAE